MFIYGNNYLSQLTSIRTSLLILLKLSKICPPINCAWLIGLITLQLKVTHSFFINLMPEQYLQVFFQCCLAK